MTRCLSRRQLLALAGANIAAALRPLAALAAPPEHLVMVHGRAQGDRDEGEIRDEWLAALAEGAEAAGVPLPGNVQVALPFYGRRLDELVELAQVPTASRITTKGNAAQDAYLRFQAELADEMRGRLGVTDEQVNAAYGDNPREKGPLNWEWVQAILKAIDAHSDTVTAGALELFTRDVFLYLELDIVRDEIDSIVAEKIPAEPVVVVGHSLGSVVAYHILRNRATSVPHFVTLGCPLGIQTIARRLAPLRYPAQVGSWVNFYDERDVVALNPLDDDHFSVTPQITNIGSVRNRTDNRHGISGYLNVGDVAGSILTALQ